MSGVTDGTKQAHTGSHNLKKKTLYGLAVPEEHSSWKHTCFLVHSLRRIVLMFVLQAT